MPSGLCFDALDPASATRPLRLGSDGRHLTAVTARAWKVEPSYERYCDILCAQNIANDQVLVRLVLKEIHVRTDVAQVRCMLSLCHTKEDGLRDRGNASGARCRARYGAVRTEDPVVGLEDILGDLLDEGNLRATRLRCETDKGRDVGR